MKDNIKIEEFKNKDIKNIIKIYKESFPKKDQFSIFVLYFNIFRRHSKLYVLKVDKKVCGFVYLIFYKNMVFILYLAITEDERNNGYGSILLKWCFNKYKDKCFYLNIDEVNIIFDDYNLRKKRMKFYLKNELYLTDYVSVNNNSKGNILSSKKIFNVKQYIILDKKISSWLFTSKDKIEKIK